MAYDARQIANFFLDLADRRGVPITTMALLKLIYFAHGWYLAKFDVPLVKNSFEAWKNGPVLRVVYESFQGMGDKPIRSRANSFDPLTAKHSLASYELSAEEQTFLEQIFDAYGHLHAFQLSDLTHEPGSPWDRLWNAEDCSSNPGMKISNESIRDHFSRRHHSEPVH